MYSKWFDGIVTTPEQIHTSVPDKNVRLVKIKNKSTLPFAEINLQRMVNSEISWAGRIDLHWISSSISHSFPHGSKIHHCWNSTDRQKNKTVKHHETLTHWVAQTAFSFYPSLEVAISYFRKYTYYSLKFKGLGPLLKSWNWYTLSTSNSVSEGNAPKRNMGPSQR